MVIWAVDDEMIGLHGLLRSVEKAAPGVEVRGYQSATEALDAMQEHQPDVLFTDIRMPEISGMEFARSVREKSPSVDIIFTTGYSDYLQEAFDLYASGYLIKPITAEKVRNALQNLRYHKLEGGRSLVIRCFGDFEVFCQGKPIPFKLRRTKELLAYLVDRHGALCSLQRASSALFEDDNHEAYAYKLRSDLIKTLEAVGCGEAISRQYGQLGIVPEKVECDYYRYLENPNSVEFHGEYMSQYSWSECTLATLLEHR